jgi:hypothetical protein
MKDHGLRVKVSLDEILGHQPFRKEVTEWGQRCSMLPKRTHGPWERAWL